MNARRPAALPRPIDESHRGLAGRADSEAHRKRFDQGTHSAHLVADAAASAPPSFCLEVYFRDDQKLFHTSSTHLDTNIPLAVGSHKITVKAFDKAGNSYSGEVYVERLSQSWAWDESAANSDAKDSKIQ